MTVAAHDVMDLVRHGLFPVHLHYPIFRDDKVSCSCGKADCKASTGKHPVNSAWGKSATQDEEIIADRWSKAQWNVGIVLGPCHGIPADQAVIDIEDDTPEGRDFAEILLAGYPAPTFTSGKSLHRLYRWTPDLPETGKANLTIDGLEFRFGGHGKETQSVAPPSIHQNGSQYRWVDGMSPDDIPIIPLPKHVVELACKKWAEKAQTIGGGSATTDARKFRSRQGKIGEGARHHSLLIEANNLWRRAFQIWGINGIEDQEAIDQVWMWIAGANAYVCDPPKSEAEVEVIFRSSQQFMQGEFEKELEAKQSQITPESKDWERSFGAYLHSHGIRLVTDPKFDPMQDSSDRIDEWVCDWGMKYVTKGDEDLVQIEIEKYSVSMHAKEFEGPLTFARRVQQQTEGKFTLDKSFVHWNWRTLWEGRPNDKKGKNGITRGIKEFLLSNAIVEEKVENGLKDQVEDLLMAMSGNLSSLLEGLEVYRVHNHKFEGRLKMTPGSGLTELKEKDDTFTGYYYDGESVKWLVKVDETMRRFRAAYGGAIVTRQLTETLESLGFERKQIRRGATAGRWYVREKDLL